MKTKTQDPWLTRPDLIRHFLDIRPSYEDLCRETQYILTKKIKDKNIEISAITSRAKTLNSFLEKLDRKPYEDPFDEITDFAGTRVVCLYIDDIPLIEKIIRKEFNVIEKVDKLSEKSADQFGYGAIHFVVRLGEKASGARYDDLKRLVCEIQLRTVLQDAWAIIDHHLVYKNEAAVPKALQRKLNSLAGLFETADDQFQQIRKQRSEYVEEIRKSTEAPKEFLARALDLDSYREYLKWRFPDQPLEAFENQTGIHLTVYQKAGFKTLGDLQQAFDEDLLSRAETALEEMKAKTVAEQLPSSAILFSAIAAGNLTFRVLLDITENQRKILDKHSRTNILKVKGRKKLRKSENTAQQKNPADAE